MTALKRHNLFIGSNRRSPFLASANYSGDDKLLLKEAIIFGEYLAYLDTLAHLGALLVSVVLATLRVVLSEGESEEK